MSQDARPTDAEALSACIEEARAASAPIRLHGGRSKDGLGYRAGGARLIDLSGLEGVVSYQPDELVLVLRPGTRLAELDRLLAEHNQHLPCETPHWGPAATVGGAVACNLSGPRRFKAGALRDFVLGVEWVDGRSRRVRAGGKVVKNVTGYDLSKVMCGSFGTLGALSEICLKVWPRPQAQRTLLRPRSDLAELRRLAGLPSEITGLALECGGGAAGTGTAYIRVEGPEPAVEAQTNSLLGQLQGETQVIEDTDSEAWWRRWRELEAFSPAPDQRLWRFTQPSTQAESLLRQLHAQALHALPPLCRCDWAGALIWALLPASADATGLHALAAAHEGTAWRFAANDEDNSHAFTPLATGAARLNVHLKQAFDPDGIFDPLRLLGA